MLNYNYKLYALDLSGNVKIRKGEEFALLLQHCTDIYVIGCLYARQFYIDDTGQLKSQTVKLSGEKSEV